MANSFGSLYVGASGLQSASHGLNTTANNLSNVNTEGYVREQVVYEDRNYQKIGEAAVSTQYRGLGVEVGTIVHARDIFLDKAYRSENGRHSFYDASSEAVQEVITHLQESDGQAFRDAIKDFEEAFEEFAKDPSDTVNQNLVLQKASLFLSRATAVEDGFEDYQTIINSKISEKLNRINEIGKEMVELNLKIQAIESAGVEKAMDLRDKRDLLIDELSGLARISYREDNMGVVHVELEQVEFIDEVTYHPVGNLTDRKTGFVTPYWPHMSEIIDPDDPSKNYYYPIYDLTNVSAENDSDIGEVKALLMARGETWSDYRNFYDEDGNYIGPDEYKKGIANSIMMNSEAELDTLIHQIVTEINNIYSPIIAVTDVYEGALTATYVDENGETVTLDASKVHILDKENCSLGSDLEYPPRELFVRSAYDRFKNNSLMDVTLTYDDGNGGIREEVVQVYVYNEEDLDDANTCYTLKNLRMNEVLEKQEAYLPHLMYKENKIAVNHNLGAALSAIWNSQTFNLNPSDTTPCGYSGFYVKWIGEIGNTGNVYKTTAQSLLGTKEEIEFSRQGVIGVSSDEELTIMIKYQSAYNAASRYINVVNEMIEHLVTSLGHV
ncbi:flagellar hook-associated protein FlgK [Pseudobutyrivibrio xylanivorans]|uniref:Flagellar hook-associated protein 1 n=1 Tax=Pseudobutyrivibrio xylanivorans DSM 14809 TaxID=1123012 RepID=A0A1M6H030_PSEXY|nr:flagellar basal body protein [Pseudobutyrivibrio xylanivorans]SHJ15546.1 flagellar hook-associated protein 1 FlgK [Pseudobutyrivibrio xylanivorans DSM 14809]